MKLAMRKMPLLIYDFPIRNIMIDNRIIIDTKSVIHGLKKLYPLENYLKRIEKVFEALSYYIIINLYFSLFVGYNIASNTIITKTM